MQPNFVLHLVLPCLMVGMLCSCHPKESVVETWRFVSMPDFLNVDCDYPQKGWEDALSFILQSIKKENPDFIVVPGDLVMGHWDSPEWNNADTIEKYASRYYTAWITRMKDHGLPFFTSVGDHEMGDNPWKEPSKVEALKYYRKAFSQHLQMPENGPEHLKGTAFWWRHKNVLFISVDVFEEGESEQGRIKAGVTGEQLQWMEQVLEEHQDAYHKMVVGHTPVLGPVRKWSSSGLMINAGRETQFWQTMIKHGVEIYLCGEVHAITCTERDGVMQIAHGGLIGYNTRTNYLLATVKGDQIELEIKEIEIQPHGNHLWQTKNNRPLENVTISAQDKIHGFYLVGSATVKRNKVNEFVDRKGYLLPQYDQSEEQAAPIFRKDFRPGVVTDLPKIVVEK